MSDRTLRELERRWKKTGGASDEAAYLLELLHVGELGPEQLELAVSFRHEAARLALGDSAPKEPEHSDLNVWAMEQFRSFPGTSALPRQWRVQLWLCQFGLMLIPTTIDLRVQLRWPVIF